MSSVKDFENQGIGSEWHTYESATHCWDCKELNGFTKTSGNGNKVTYLYDEGATQDSEQRVLKFFEKFQTTLKQD
jgi:dienelactone hydrolase